MAAIPSPMAAAELASGLTRQIARFAVQSQYRALPPKVQAEAPRAFLNWVGCVFGGCADPAVEAADDALAEAGGHPQATVIGRGWRTDMAGAAFLNCLSSTVNSFDDTHLATVTHPTGPVAAALFAYAEKYTVGGEAFVNALTLGIEVQCRLSKVLLAPPAKGNLGLFITGITGPIGAAVALGSLMNLDEQHMCWAIGLAATQASGMRATHGAMSAFLVPAHAARSGFWGAVFARKGITCTENILEAPKGFVEIFSQDANLGLATDGLGRDFEMLDNAYKPYPCGIVVQPAIDACLDVAMRIPDGRTIKSVRLGVHPLALDLCGRRNPGTPIEAQLSLYHWAAASLVQRAAGLDQMQMRCVDNSEVTALRNCIDATGDSSLGRDQAYVQVHLDDGQVLDANVLNARGSKGRPLTDDELDSKFRQQTQVVLSGDATDRLLQVCRGVVKLQDVGRDIAGVWTS